MACMSCDSCLTCNTCQGCYSCRGCYNCNTCDSCQKCNNGCQADDGNGCVTLQAICTINTNSLKTLCGDTFKFSPCPETTTLMGSGTNHFNKASWDAICEWIAQRADYGETVAGGTDFSNSDNSDVAPFKAAEFNRISDELSCSTKATALTKIKGSYFKALETATGSYKISTSACDKCNAACNVTCCVCQSYDSTTDKCSSQRCSSQRCVQHCTSGNDCAATPTTQ